MSYLEIEKAFEIAYENKLKYVVAEYQSKIKELEERLEKTTLTTTIKTMNPFEESAKLEMEQRIKVLEGEIVAIRAERDTMDGRRKTNLHKLDNANKQIANMREMVQERDKTIAELTEANNKLAAMHATAITKLKGELAVEVKEHMSIKSKLEECERQRDHIYDRRQYYADLYKTTKAKLDKLSATPCGASEPLNQKQQRVNQITQGTEYAGRIDINNKNITCAMGADVAQDIRICRDIYKKIFGVDAKIVISPIATPTSQYNVSIIRYDGDSPTSTTLYYTPSLGRKLEVSYVPINTSYSDEDLIKKAYSVNTTHITDAIVIYICGYF